MAQEDYEMNVAIVTDSNSGIFEQEGKILGVHVIPMPVILEGKTYYEGIDLIHEEFYQCLEENREVFSSHGDGDVPGYARYHMPRMPCCLSAEHIRRHPDAWFHPYW